MRVLIADDDAVSRRLLQTTLERAGYSVVAVDNGASAARLLCEADGPRLALLDWMMPGLDGPGVVRAVREHHDQPYVHMVLLTSKQSKEDIVAGLDSGADDYLTKPYHPQELRARLRTGERILLLEDRLVEAREEMRFRATHDPLTTLWNRGMIEELLERELQRVKRDVEDGCVALVLGDVDRFKSVNDTYGHAAGDAVLYEVAMRFKGAVRNYDAVSRYGGEEFLILLSGCGTRCAMTRAEQLRRAVESKPIDAQGQPVPVTISLGVVVSSDWENLGGSALIREADAALYHAKREGRNLVALATPGGLQIQERQKHDRRTAVTPEKR